MYSSIHFDRDKLLVNHLEYLRRHDLVYRSPAYKGFDAMPVGNGDLGGMIWNTPRTIEISLNKADVVDFGTEGRFKAWAWESEEKNTAQVSCGRLSIADGMPSFDRLYLEEFEQRLNLAGALMELKSETPFSRWETGIIASRDYQALVVEIDAAAVEPVERRIRLERWGSRSFFHYYEQFVGDPSIRLGRTSAGSLHGCIFVRQDLRGTSFATGAKLIGAEPGINLANSHTAEFILPPEKEAKVTLLLATVAGKPGENLPEEAVGLLEKAAAGLEDVYRRHREAWQSFWEESFVHLDDDYVENLYYLHLYQLNSCGTGRYPVSFGGLWTWHGDSRNWGHYYHWNHQQTYWGVHAAGHPELAANYLEYRFGMLENARRDAREVFGTGGAFFSDISDFHGYQAIEPDTIVNYTAGPQIAMDFYRHYQYTCDRSFLKDKAYPVMKACADFYCGLLEKTDGVYHLKSGATSYESYWNLRDTITDYAMIKVLFATLCEVSEILGLEKDSIPGWRDIVDNLFAMPTTSYTKDDGEKVKIIAAGMKWDGDPVQYLEGDYPRSPFVACQFAPIFPAGLIGLKDAGTEAFATARDTARLIFDREVYENGRMGCSGHTPCPAVAARLGMKEDTGRLLALFAERYQAFTNGLTHYLDLPEYGGGCYTPCVLKGDEAFTLWEQVHEKQYGTRVRMDAERFLHAYFEPAANIMCGVNEMLLQSHDGAIRVFPAAGDTGNAVFSLRARGNFQVTSEKRGREIPYIHIRSHAGEKCRVCLPWTEAFVFMKNKAASSEFEVNQGTIEFDTQPGDSILIYRKNYRLENYYKTALSSQPNQAVKRKGKRTLGRVRDF